MAARCGGGAGEVVVTRGDARWCWWSCMAVHCGGSDGQGYGYPHGYAGTGQAGTGQGLSIFTLG
jgi:hypothetical protein